MLRFKLKKSAGFTIAEFIVASVIGVVLLGIVWGIWNFVHRGWTIEQRLIRARVDLQIAMERIKEEMRLSSLNYTSYYPPAGPPYTAVSFPMATADSNNSNFLDLDANGNIDWDTSVIYYLYDDDGNKKLKRTVITANDAFLTDTDDRDGQVSELANAASEPTGTGSGMNGTHPSNLKNKGNATTTTIIENVTSFTLTPTYQLFDGYSAATQRSDKVDFGVVNLDSTYDAGDGYHDFKFEVVGTSNTGYKMGIDSIAITPSGCEREAEVIFLSTGETGTDPLRDTVSKESGGTAAPVTAAGWSGGQYLEYSSGGVGDYINMRLYYDVYRESNFDGSTRVNAYLTGGQVKLGDFNADEGIVEGWTALGQTAGAGQGYYGATPTSMANITARNLVSSAALQVSLGTTTYDLVRVKFVSHPTLNYDLQIVSAYIAERNMAAANADALDPKVQLYFTDGFGNIAPGATITAGSSLYSNWTIFGINPLKDYFVTFHITGVVADSYVSYWPDGMSGAPHSYLLTYDPPSDKSAVADWPAPVDRTSAAPPAELPVAPASGSECTVTSNIYGIEEIEVYRSSGSVLSDVYDTQFAGPAYNDIGWTESVSANADVRVEAGSSDDANMSSATWDFLDSNSTINPHSLSISTGKFVQSEATLSAVPYWKCLTCGATYTNAQYSLTPPASHLCTLCSLYLVPAINSPEVDNITVDWPGGTQLCEVSGYFTQKPDYGIIKLTVDGQGFTKGLDIAVTITNTFPSMAKTYETSLITSAEPRNTGR
jgi:hypothetical protein